MPVASVLDHRTARVVEALGNRLTVRASARETGGVCGIIDFEVAPSFAAPPSPHQHTREDWWGHVTEGELVVEVAGEARHLRAGTTVFVPRGVPFRWWNPTPHAARWTLTWAPGGFEQYFVDLAAAIAAQPPRSPAAFAQLVGPLWAAYGIQVVPVGSS